MHMNLVQVLSLALGLTAAPQSPARPPDRPRVEVWTTRGDEPYTAGQPARVYFQAEQDAYVTILRVDTDGRVRMLFPREPWDDNFARGGRIYEVQGGTTSEAFDVDDYPGVGYLFAIVSTDRFAYDQIENDEHWDYRSIADGGRVRGDPYVALTDLAERLLPAGSADWDYDIAPYYVERHYDYPRFLCYDCHTYVSYPYWNPYQASCVRFRVVVYDDPYYYPYRYYGGMRAVFRRPFRPEPRFIFRDRTATDQFVTRVRERPVNDDRRREVGGRDGRIVVPPPHIVVPPRARPATPGQPHDDTWRRDGNGSGRDGGRARPDDRTQRDWSRRPSDGGEKPRPEDRPERPQAREPDRPQPRPENQQPRDDRRARPSQPDNSERGRAEPRRDSGKHEGKRDEPELRRRRP